MDMEVKMKGNTKTAHSRLKISEDVIITVARLAAHDVKGVAGLDGEINAISKGDAERYCYHLHVSFDEMMTA